MLAATASAAATPPGSGSADEPGVARVSLIDGRASYLRSDGGDWVSVAVNAPLVTGDRFYSGPDSRSEIQLAPGFDARLAGQTELDLVELAPDGAQVRLSLGQATFRVRREAGARRVELDTPVVALLAREPGVYRVQVESDGRTTVMVRDGTLEVSGGDAGSYGIASGSGAVIAAPGGSPERFALGPADDWDSWESGRARRAESATSYQYVSSDIYGAEDLDDNGAWEYRRGYGELWRPTAVAADWAPYTTGRWVWQPPWGWTWLDYQPWGWAPFHYGRWVYLDDSWFWAPGPAIASPEYAPALVGFYGDGWDDGGISVSFGGGGPWIGWAPLGWGEPCIPWWGGFGHVHAGVPWWGGWGGPRVVNNVFINKQINNFNIDTHKIRFTNAHFPGGFTAVSRRSFVTGEHERMPIGHLDESRIMPISGRLPVTPEGSSMPAAPPRAQLASNPVPPGGRSAVAPQRADVAPGSTSNRQPLAIGGGKAIGAPDRSRSALSGGTTGPADSVVRAPLAPPGTSAVALRPPVANPSAEHLPVAPRPDGQAHVPYVARRPAFDGVGGSPGVGMPHTGMPPGRTGFGRSSVGSVSDGRDERVAERESLPPPSSAPRRTVEQRLDGGGSARVPGSPPRARQVGSGGSLSVIHRIGPPPSAAPVRAWPANPPSQVAAPPAGSYPHAAAPAVQAYAPRSPYAPRVPVAGAPQRSAVVAVPAQGGGMANAGPNAGGSTMSGGRAGIGR